MGDRGQLLVVVLIGVPKLTTWLVGSMKFLGLTRQLCFSFLNFLILIYVFIAFNFSIIVPYCYSHVLEQLVAFSITANF